MVVGDLKEGVEVYKLISFSNDSEQSTGNGQACICKYQSPQDQKRNQEQSCIIAEGTRLLGSAYVSRQTYNFFLAVAYIQTHPISNYMCDKLLLASLM